MLYTLVGAPFLFLQILIIPNLLVFEKFPLLLCCSILFLPPPWWASFPSRWAFQPSPTSFQLQLFFPLISPTCSFVHPQSWVSTKIISCSELRSFLQWWVKKLRWVLFEFVFVSKCDFNLYLFFNFFFCNFYLFWDWNADIA